MASTGIRQVERKALDGPNESQDTLEIAHYLMRAYGVSLVSAALEPDSRRASGQLAKPARLLIS